MAAATVDDYLNGTVPADIHDQITFRVECIMLARHRRSLVQSANRWGRSFGQHPATGTDVKNLQSKLLGYCSAIRATDRESERWMKCEIGDCGDEAVAGCAHGRQRHVLLCHEHLMERCPVENPRCSQAMKVRP